MQDKSKNKQYPFKQISKADYAHAKRTAIKKLLQK